MTMHLLVVGALTSDPTERTGNSGKRFATASLQFSTEDDTVLGSLIAFGDAALDLLQYRAGSVIAVSGRGKFTLWSGRDGAEHHGIGITVEQVSSAAAARQADANRRSQHREAAE